ncbi:hypothetical protein AgCh_006272 [Apium graveolens]
MENGEKVVFKGQRQERLFLTIVQAKKYVRKGCESFIAYVVDSERENPNIEDISVVNEFPDVFLEELPDLPPDRQIEFEINIAPGTEPVSKAPYRMAQMKELANQLQELLDKGVIWPNGATYCVCKDGLSDSVWQIDIDYTCGAGADCSAISQGQAPKPVIYEALQLLLLIHQCTALATTGCVFLQVADIDYSYGAGADCSAISQSGYSFNPNTLKDHYIDCLYYSVEMILNAIYESVLIFLNFLMFGIVQRFLIMKTAALEEPKNESAEEVDAEDESNTGETKPEVAELDSKSDGFGEKPDINDALEKENKAYGKLLLAVGN